MRRGINAIVNTPSEESIAATYNSFKEGQWTVVNLASMPSSQLSECERSHVTCNSESTYLGSPSCTARGSVGVSSEVISPAAFAVSKSGNAVEWGKHQQHLEENGRDGSVSAAISCSSPSQVDNNSSNDGANSKQLEVPPAPNMGDNRSNHVSLPCTDSSQFTPAPKRVTAPPHRSSSPLQQSTSTARPHPHAGSNGDPAATSTTVRNSVILEDNHSNNVSVSVNYDASPIVESIATCNLRKVVPVKNKTNERRTEMAMTSWLPHVTSAAHAVERKDVHSERPQGPTGGGGGRGRLQRLPSQRRLYLSDAHREAPHHATQEVSTEAKACTLSSSHLSAGFRKEQQQVKEEGQRVVQTPDDAHRRDRGHHSTDLQEVPRVTTGGACVPVVRRGDDSTTARVEPTAAQLRASVVDTAAAQLASSAAVLDTPRSPGRRPETAAPSSCFTKDLDIVYRSLPSAECDAAAKSPDHPSSSARPPQAAHIPAVTQSAVALTRHHNISQYNLLRFVRSVQDPEVLHVIHDYLVEQKREEPRYTAVAEVCADLLRNKEKLLLSEREREAHESGNTSTPPVCLPTVDVTNMTAAERRATALALAMEEAAAAAAAAGAEEQRQEGESEGEDSLFDEFDECTTNCLPYPRTSRFSVAEPSVTGFITPVFREGLLYKIVDAAGDHYFLNDTMQQVMMVRVHCVLTGKEKISDKATQAAVPLEAASTAGGRRMRTRFPTTRFAAESNLTEITLAVPPGETAFLISGVPPLLHVMARAIPVPHDYTSPAVTQCVTQINSGINEVRRALGQWGCAADANAYLRCCLKSHLKFTDLQFRPGQQSLSAPQDPFQVAALPWHRPEEYLALTEVAEARIFRGCISCHAVQQGELSDHSVIAAIAAVALNPAHVRWLFRDPRTTHQGRRERKVGAYRVWVLRNGWWTSLLLDDYFPASCKSPLFARCPRDPRVLWPSLLEKAVAKARGSYAALCSLDVMEVLTDLTGLPVRYLDALWTPAKAEAVDNIIGKASVALFRFLQRAVNMGCTVLFFTPPSSDASATASSQDLSRRRRSRLLLPHRKRSEEKGGSSRASGPQFFPGRVYFLTETAHYSELDLRMIRLRNPWTWETPRVYRGDDVRKEWKFTRWFDEPSLASSTSLMGSSMSCLTVPGGSTDTSISALMSRDERCGTMWLEWRDVLRAFYGGGVCYTMPGWRSYRVRGCFLSVAADSADAAHSSGWPSLVLEMRSTRNIAVYITLSQADLPPMEEKGSEKQIAPPTLCGVALVTTHHNRRKNCEEIQAESCDDIECLAGMRTYVYARDVSMKLMVGPKRTEPQYVVPLLDPQDASTVLSKGQTLGFVLSILTSEPLGLGDISAAFKQLPRTSAILHGGRDFSVSGAAALTTVTARYQCCRARGVVELEGNELIDESAKESAV